MKKKIFILCSLFLTTKVIANVPLDSVKQATTIFLKEVEHKIIAPNSLCNCLFIDRLTQKEIEEGETGIFIFSTLSSSEFVHLLLIDKTSFEIINTRISLEFNLKIILNFLKKNTNYTKNEILFYLDELLRIYELNDKNIQDTFIHRNRDLLD